MQGGQGEKTKVLAQVRHARILDVLAEFGALSVSDVAGQLNVSEMTIRRDLAELEKEGKLARTHGGAVRSDQAADPAPAPAAALPGEPSFQLRAVKNGLAKQAIAAEAETLSAGARTIALDVGTTTLLLARRLQDRQHTKIFTSSVRNAFFLGEGLAEVYLPGGRMRGDEMSISGPSAIAEFEALWFDIAFIGISGLTEQGIYDYSFDDAEMKRVFLARSTRKVVLCDASKFSCMSLVHVADLQQFDVLITDAEPPADIAKALSKAEVEVRIASPARKMAS
ncbi:DeoR/GlpR family DNA-binding transcription regulator [Martelella radicis]|uniref:DeoR family glycerol-3-phosphate regulon repressor n=1 Tax=Martelella radicis TaxID=1397476 RepID=A0A7W6PAH8_9HYPH|nr:DeoR/GlpR family DNA-binding transcription regulator [Martelella radicis]MBB4123352.1 DeoR family glycerol-3-phosphate regulon repressor [Martelella radicis]